MTDAPTYISQVRAPQPGSFDVRPQAVPNVPDYSGVGKAAAELGGAAVKFAATAIEAHELTRLNQAKADYLTRLDQLEQQYSRDPDFQTAPARFDQEHGKLREDVLAGRADDKNVRTPFSEIGRARLDAALATHGIVVTRRVRNLSLAREADVNRAALEVEGSALLRNASNAGSPTEREAYRGEYHRTVDEHVGSFWITAEGGALKKQKFDREIEQGDLLRLINDNPKEAKARLADPRNFASLEPDQRERFRAAAEQAADTRGALELGAKARFHPEAVSLTLDRLADPAHAARLVKTAIIPQESGGDPAAVSRKGALGLTQIMPETAREMARKVGRRDIAELSDPDLKKVLLEDAGLNEKLGTAYFTEMLARYDGKISLALAAYNAGPTRVDVWRQEAVKKFGENFTPAQFASVVTVKETREYLGKIYERAGAPMEGPGLSVNGFYRAAEHVRSEINQDETARSHAARELAAATRSADDPAELFKEGFLVDPERARQYRETQEQAAMRGDRSAAEALQKFDHWQAMAPYVRAAYSMPPALLKQTVAAIEAELAASPTVTLEQKRRLDAFKAVAAEIEKRKDLDPVSLYERAFHATSVALDPQGDPTSAAFRSALAARGRQAVDAAAIYGGAVKPLKPSEAETLKMRFAEMGENEKMGFIAALADTMPEASYRAALGQVGAGNLEVIAGWLGRERPELARKILHGSALLKEEGVKPKADEMRPAFASILRGELYPDPRMQDAVTDAAVAVYVADRGKAGALYDPTDTAALERAIEQVTGPIMRRNGQRVPTWPGLTAARFSALLDHLDENVLAPFGGAHDRNGQPFDPAALGRRGLLKAHEPGSPRYFVGMPDPSARDGFVPVFTSEGTPLVIDVRTLAERGRDQIPLTPRMKGITGEEIVRERQRERIRADEEAQ